MLGAVNSLAQVKGNVKFAYNLAKNRKYLTEECELMRGSAKPSEELGKYEDDRIETCKKFCDKNDNGEPKTVNGSFIGLENNKEFEAALKLVQEKHKKALAEHEEKIKAFNKMLEEEMEIELWAIKLSDVPDNITAEQLQPLMPIIDEEEKPKLEKVG